MSELSLEVTIKIGMVGWTMIAVVPSLIGANKSEKKITLLLKKKS